MSDTLESTIPPLDDIAEREARADAARMTRYFMMFAAPLLIMFVILIGAFAWKLSHPKIAARFPRPTPPKDADFTDYCQRRGSFGPKRSGGMGQPGEVEGGQGLAIYAFYTAGIQIFDVKDPANPTIAGYFVPRFPTDAELPDYAKENSTFAVFTEYDRKIIWAFSVNGVYALSSPLLGKPNLGAPKAVWPERR